MTGIITEIQRGSIHDGPGFRTVVFLKGCPLRCYWCHNPETISPRPELLFEPEKCIGCGGCFAVCPAGARTRDGIDRERCRACFACAGACPTGALRVSGREITVDEAMEQILADRPFYRASDGGVTLSGGEPLRQVAFAEELLARCRREGVRTAVESSLYGPEETLRRILPLTDLVMADLKSPDDAAHREATGVSNRTILDNLRRVASAGIPLIVRTPVVPGFNDDPETIAEIAAFAARLGSLRYYELLKYHPLGCRKAEQLGASRRARPLPGIPPERWRSLIAAALRAGIPVYANGRKQEI